VRPLARAGIPLKVVATLVVAAALASIASLAFFAGRERQRVASELVAAAERHAERLAVALREPLYAFDRRTAADLARAEFLAPEVCAVVIREAAGHVLVFERRGAAVVEAAAPADEPARVVAVRTVRRGDGQALGEVAVHLTPEGARARFVELLLQAIAERLWLLALVSVAGWWLLVRFLVHPLDVLHRAVVDTRQQLGLGGAGGLPERDPLEGDVAAFRELREMGRSHHELVRSVNEAARARSTLQDKLRQSERMDALGQLAGGVAHDLNNLLTPIAAYADLIREGARGDAELEEHAGLVGETARRASALTRKLLAFSRKTAPARRPLDLHEVAAEVMALLRHALNPRVRIVTALDAPEHGVMGDAPLLQNAILNLCVNARDAMPDGGTLRLETRIVEGERGRRLELAVSDTGVGMAPEVQARAFEPFFTTKPVGHGTGLGLAAVYATMKEHGGSVSFTSRPGAGTTFRLLFPLASQAPGGQAAPAAAPGGAGARVLVIEHDPAVRRAAVAALRGASWAADESGTGADGIALLRGAPRGAYRAVLLDVAPPHANGREVLDAIRAVDPEVPVLVTSGSGREELEDVLAREGTAFLAKPFSARELAQALGGLVARPPRSRVA